MAAEPVADTTFLQATPLGVAELTGALALLGRPVIGAAQAAPR